MEQLKPCPFCGGEAKTEVSYIQCGGDELLLRAAVFCKVCGVGRTVRFNAELKPFEDFTENFNTAVDMWNRRATDV